MEVELEQIATICMNRREFELLLSMCTSYSESSDITEIDRGFARELKNLIEREKWIYGE